MDHFDRAAVFTNKEFTELARYGNGDVIDLSTAFVWMTAGQKARLTGDDETRLDDYEEEVRVMYAGISDAHSDQYHC